MNENKKNTNSVTLEGIARMVANGFLDVNERLDTMATKDELIMVKKELKKEIQNEVGALRKEVRAGFDDMNAHLNAHMKDVRTQTDGLAFRTKKLEETVFGIGKYPIESPE